MGKRAGVADDGRIQLPWPLEMRDGEGSSGGGWQDPVATADGSGGSEGEHLDPWMARTACLDLWMRAPMLEVLLVRRGR
jgi:hypothetical protein